MMRDRFPLAAAVVASTVVAAVSACAPTVQMAAPKEPITINLNIKLDAEVRLKLEEKAKEDIKKNSEIF